MQGRADLLFAGRYDDLTRLHASPLPLYFGRSRILIDSRDAMRDYFRCLHQVLQAGGVTALAAKVMAQELPRQGRFRIWVDWAGGDPCAQSPDCHNTVYYCTTRSGGMQVEMIGYPRQFAPDLLKKWQDMRKSA